jgi:hypothetical protein
MSWVGLQKQLESTFVFHLKEDTDSTYWQIFDNTGVLAYLLDHEREWYWTLTMGAEMSR